MNKRVLEILFLLILIGAVLGSVGYLAVGYANSPTIDADFTNAVTNDPGTTTDPGKNRHVASCEADLPDSKHLTIEITDAYPSYECVIWATVTNVGTEPLTIVSVALSSPGNEDELDITPAGFQGVTLDLGESVTGHFTIHVKQAATENAEYILQGTIVVDVVDNG